jgi:hypothetical protein
LNFYNVKNSGTGSPGVRVYAQNESNTLFEIDKSTNNIPVGTFDETSINGGTLKIGGNDLQLYSANDFKLKNLNQTNTITSDVDNFKISSSSGKDIKIAYGMQFEDEGTNLIIKKPGDPTKGVKIQWTTL